MKIVRFEAENIKKLKVVEITPDGYVVEITGPNGAGKTSVLDAIWWALAGAGNVQAAPIRQGETEARIVLDLGELVVTRTFKLRENGNGEVTTALKVEATNGARFPSPQKMLDGLLGALAFDPLEFTRKDPRAQVLALRAFVPDVDFAGMEKANKADYDARTEFNREARQQEQLAAGINLPPDALMTLVDERPILADLQRAGATNAEIAACQASRQKHIDAMGVQQAKLDTIVAQMRELEARLEVLDYEAKCVAGDLQAAQKVKDNFAPLPALVDTAKLTADLQAVQQMNRTAAMAQQRKLHQEAEARARIEAEACTARIKKRVADMHAAVTAAKMPVPGLSFADDGSAVLLNGVPFDQASTAEQLRTACAIAMENDPQLKVIRVRDGSVLDRASMQALADAAAAYDFQVWIETVESDSPAAVHIEDGMVVS